MSKGNTFQALEAIEELFNHPGLLGFQSLARDLQIAHRNIQNVQAYPPRNIIKFDENHWLVEVAVAGFHPNELNISTKDSCLTISGDSQVYGDSIDVNDYIHHGLARRNWSFTIRLGENVEVSEECPPSLKNGILEVTLERNIPEESDSKEYHIVTQDD